MRDILTAIGAYVALNKVAKMLTEPLKTVPLDWQLARWTIAITVVGVAIGGVGMFFVYALNYIVTNWPF